jgi:hypothetical protein
VVSAVFFGILLVCFAAGVYCGWKRRWLLAVPLVALAVAGVLSARPAPLFGVDSHSLQLPVGGQTPPQGDCERLAGGDWRCRLYDDDSSTWVPYRIQVDGLGCWHGTLGWPGERGAPPRLSGCVRIYDYVF